MYIYKYLLFIQMNIYIIITYCSQFSQAQRKFLNFLNVIYIYIIIKFLFINLYFVENIKMFNLRMGIT